MIMKRFREKRFYVKREITGTGVQLEGDAEHF